MKTLWIISSIVGLGAVAWYFVRQSVPVGVAAPDPGFTVPTGGVTFGAGASGNGDVSQAIVSGGPHSGSTPTATGFQLIATLHPATGTRPTPPPPTAWRKV